MANMQSITPNITNITPITGRMINNENEVHNIVDNYGSVKTIDIGHTSVHDGISYIYTGAASDIASNQSLYFLGRTNNITAHLFNFFVQSDQAPMTIQFFEAPIVTSPGTVQSAINRNRQLMTPAIMSVYAGSVVSADGTELLLARILGDKKTVTSEDIQGEWLLKKNTDYVFKITNNSTQSANISAGFNWLESN